MELPLTNQEIEELTAFRLATIHHTSDRSIELEQLTESKKLADYMQSIASLIGSPNPKATASVFMKRYAFLPVIYLYAMTVFNKRLDISFENVSIETPGEKEQWLPLFYLKNKSALISGSNREEWRRISVKGLLNENLIPLMNSLVKEAKISRLILWENIAIYVYWLYEKVLFHHKDQEIRHRAQEDFYYLIHEAPSVVFGDDQQNPLQRNHNDPVFIRELGEKVRIRSTCCFHYMLQNSQSFCKTCPRKCKPATNVL